jgi:hypothetical protein
MLRTAIVEMQSALGAHTARIQLASYRPNREADFRTVVEKGDNLNPIEKDQIKPDTNESD